MDGKAVKAILFDLDNTLIETSRAGRVAIQKVIKSDILHVAFKVSFHICNVRYYTRSTYYVDWWLVSNYHADDNVNLIQVAK